MYDQCLGNVARWAFAISFHVAVCATTPSQECASGCVRAHTLVFLANTGERNWLSGTGSLNLICQLGPQTSVDKVQIGFSPLWKIYVLCDVPLCPAVYGARGTHSQPTSLRMAVNGAELLSSNYLDRFQRIARLNYGHRRWETTLTHSIA
jgi:hypothetical protein